MSFHGGLFSTGLTPTFGAGLFKERMKTAGITFVAFVLGAVLGFMTASARPETAEKRWEIYTGPGPGDLKEFNMKLDLWKMNNCDDEVTRLRHLVVTVGGQSFTNDLRLGQECPVNLGAAGTFIFHPYDWDPTRWGTPESGFRYLRNVWVKVTRQ